MLSKFVILLIIITSTSLESIAFSPERIQPKTRCSNSNLFSNNGFRVGSIVTTICLTSGLSPAIRIISESNKSRLPDCPIAHDIDTLLLWPVTEQSIQMGQRISVFSKPAAAFTTDPLTPFDWKQVAEAFTNRCITTSLVCTLIILLFFTLQKLQSLRQN